MTTFNFTTGPATLPDVGELSYNKCVFGPLFNTHVSCQYVKDAANRTTKYIEYTIVADGYVTLPDGAANVEGTMVTLEKLLSAPAGKLMYSGRGIKIAVNVAGGDTDVMWGPVPEVLEIVPLGGGRSAHVTWTVKARVPPRVPKSGSRVGPVLQFNYETAVKYDEAGYSSLRISGTTEVPLTRVTQTDRTVPQTADEFRFLFPGRLLATIDLTRFKVVDREFKLSRDKRTLEFDVTAVERSWMELPPGITIARGSFSFKPVRSGMGLCNWLCTLSCTYTVPKSQPRRLAWLAFLALLQQRMKMGNRFGVVPATNGNQNPPGLAVVAAAPLALIPGAPIIAPIVAAGLIARPNPGQVVDANRKVFLMDFSGNEGLYDDGRTVSFSASWRLVTVFSEILLASGLWKKVPEHTNNLWATSVAPISRHTSWLNDVANPNLDAIVDFGT